MWCEKIMWEKIFGAKIILVVRKNNVRKNICGAKKYCGKKYLVRKYLWWREKIMCEKIFVVRKNICGAKK